MPVFLKIVSQLSMGVFGTILTVGVALDWHSVPSDTSYGWASAWFAVSLVVFMLNIRAEIE